MILSPMPTGSGAIVVHRMLEKAIQGYRVAPYSPYCEFFPPLLSFKFRSKTAELIHTTPDYGLFFTKSRRPLIVTFHNFVLDRFMCKHSTLYQRIHYNTDLKWFTKHSLRSATAITSVSKFIAELAGKELGIKDDIRIIYNGIDENKFTPRTKKRNKTIKILVVGNQSQ